MRDDFVLLIVVSEDQQALAKRLFGFSDPLAKLVVA
jgi:hypothetical protein